MQTLSCPSHRCSRAQGAGADQPREARAHRRLGRVAAPFLLLSLAACTATLGTGNDGDIGETPPECAAPGASPVTKLLRLSNEEYQNIASDVIGSPVGDERFIAWTPVAEVYGFDTMSATRIDARALDEQLRTAAELAVLVLDSPELTSACPSRLTPAAPEDGVALTWTNCGAAVMTRFASRAFRRPLRPEVRTR